MVVKTLKNILYVLSTGYIFVYFSEHLFWARVRPDDSLGSWLGTWVAYSLLAYLFLTIIYHFHIRTIWGLFLAGAAFGWLAEGVIVQTTYESLPLSISFTGLAWHALVTVWVGWYALQKSLTAPDRFASLKLSVLIGFCYGLWSIAWWLEPDGGIATLAEFARYSLLITILVLIAYGIANWSITEPFKPNRWTTIVIAGLFILYFLFVAVPAAPLALVILPILLGLVYLGLYRKHRNAVNSSIFDGFGEKTSLLKFLSLLAIPFTAILVYWVAVSLNLRWHTNWLLYLVTTPLGFVLFGISVYRSLRNQPTP